jgi:hypothetical protein
MATSRSPSFRFAQRVRLKSFSAPTSIHSPGSFMLVSSRTRDCGNHIAYFLAYTAGSCKERTSTNLERVTMRQVAWRLLPLPAAAVHHLGWTG